MKASRFGSVYLLTNSTSGEQYVGQTVKALACRLSAHRRAAAYPKLKVQKAIAEHGWRNFVVEEVFVAFDRVGLDAAEREWIAALKPAYNKTKGGVGSASFETTEALRLKRSEAAKKRWADPEWKARTVAALRKAGQSEAAKERGRRVAAHRVANMPPKKIKPAKVPQTLAEKVAATSASWKDPAIRARRLAGLRAANERYEVKAKRSAASLGRKIPREAVERAAAQRRGVRRTPEQVARIRAGMAAGRRSTRVYKSRYTPEFFAQVVARVDAGEKQTHVARNVGIDPGYLSAVLAGKRPALLRRVAA